MTGKKRGGLGRGLGALIPETMPERVGEQGTENPLAVRERDAIDAPASQGPLQVQIEAVSPNPRQPRQAIHPDKLEDLAASIREHGVIQPLLVTSLGGGKYGLIAGERRWRAAQMAGLTTVPVVTKEATSGEQLQLALVENLQRADLNPLEAASAYRSLIDDFGLTQEEVADRVGKSRTSVANSLRLLRLPPQVLESLSFGMIEEGHARALLQVPDEGRMLRLLERTVADGLNVRQVEALARRLAQTPAQGDEDAAAQTNSKELYDEVRDIEERFTHALGTKVQLSKSSRGKGKLVIYFFSDEELDRIYGAIVGDED